MNLLKNYNDFEKDYFFECEYVVAIKPDYNVNDSGVNVYYIFNYDVEEEHIYLLYIKSEKNI